MYRDAVPMMLCLNLLLGCWLILLTLATLQATDQEDGGSCTGTLILNSLPLGSLVPRLASRNEACHWSLMYCTISENGSSMYIYDSMIWMCNFPTWQVGSRAF